MRKTDQVCSVFWLILGGVISFQSYRLGLGSGKEPGPGFIPFWVGFLIVVLGVVLLVRSLLAQKHVDRASEPLKAGNWIKVGVVTLSLIVYLAVMSALGYLLSTFLFLSFLLNISHRKGWPIRVIAAAFIAVSTFVAFRVWLDCPLPKGIFSIGL